MKVAGQLVSSGSAVVVVVGVSEFVEAAPRRGIADAFPSARSRGGREGFGRI